jgi:hypothetical protein
MHQGTTRALRECGWKEAKEWQGKTQKPKAKNPGEGKNILDV